MRKSARRIQSYALAVSSHTPVASMPELPTIAASGVPAISRQYGGTKSLRQRTHTISRDLAAQYEIDQALQTPALKARLDAEARRRPRGRQRSAH
jgi:hypothetical protein